MATIGTFTRNEDGTFQGSIRTLSLNTKVRFVPATSGQREGPGPARLRGQRHRVRGGLDQAHQGRAFAPTTRSSSTTRASPTPSSPAWSKLPTRTPSRWSGAAEPGLGGRPARKAGRRCFKAAPERERGPCAPAAG